jgi:hypothetical protein
MYMGARAGNKPSTAEKDTITLNYPIGIHGKWLGNKYRFMTRSSAWGRIFGGKRGISTSWITHSQATSWPAI